MISFVDVIFTIVGSDTAKKYMLLGIYNWCKWVDCNVGEIAMNLLFFYIFLTGTSLENLIPNDIMGLKILKQKCACGSSFIKIIRKPHS